MYVRTIFVSVNVCYVPHVCSKYPWGSPENILISISCYNYFLLRKCKKKKFEEWPRKNGTSLMSAGVKKPLLYVH